MTKPDLSAILNFIQTNIKWIADYQNREKSVGTAAQTIAQLQEKRLRCIEYIQYHQKLLCEVEEKIARRERVIETNTAYCAKNEKEYLRLMNLVDEDTVKQIDKAQKTLEKLGEESDD